MTPRWRAIRAALAVFALAFSAPSFASEHPLWRPVDAQTGQLRDIEALERLASDFPDSGNVRMRLLQPYLEAGEVEKIMELLEWLYDRGYVFNDVAKSQIPKLLEGVDPGRIAERLRAEPDEIAASEVVATVPAQAGLTESVLYDADRDVFIVTSYSEGAVWAVNRSQVLSRTKHEIEGKLSGLVRDQQRDHYWVSAGSIGSPFAKNEPHSGLTTYCPDLLEGCSTFSLRLSEDAASLNELVVVSDGTIFASDSLGGGIYRLATGDGPLEQFIAPGTFRSPQGLAVSADNTKLYVSDYRYGIAIIDLDTQEVFRLASDIPLILDGVDGLWRYDNELIAVQNGTSPMRISAFELSDDGMRVVTHRILEQANPEWTEPLGGSIVGDSLIYIGNGQWDRYVEGELADGKEALPTEIRRLLLKRE